MIVSYNHYLILVLGFLIAVVEPQGQVFAILVNPIVEAISSFHLDTPLTLLATVAVRMRTLTFLAC